MVFREYLIIFRLILAEKYNFIIIFLLLFSLFLLLFMISLQFFILFIGLIVLFQLVLTLFIAL